MEYWKEHFEKHGKEVEIYGNSMLIVIPPGMPELAEEARKIVEGRD